MQEIVFTRRFKKDVKKFVSISKQIEKQVDLFISKPSHPSLRKEKLQPKEIDRYSFRIT